LLFLLSLTNQLSVILWTTPYLFQSLAWILFAFRFGNFNSKFKMTLKIGYSFAFIDLFYITFLRSDRIWLSALCGNSDLGIYVVASTFIELSIIYFLFDAEITLARIRRNAVSSKQLMHKLVRVNFFTFGLLILIILISKSLIPFLFGPTFAPGVKILLPLAISALLLINFSYLVHFVIAFGKNSQVFLSYMMPCFVSLFVYPLMIDNRCYWGAAWGSVWVYLSGCLVTFILAAKIVH
jgi:O-antigen/teichoic acid export membrane protein